MEKTYAYQKKIAQKAITLLEKEGKAAVVLPTGCGKSYIAAEIIRYYIEHYKKEGECVIWGIHHKIICDAQIEKFCKTSYEDIVPCITPVIYNSMGKYDGLRPFLIILDEFHHIGSMHWWQNVKKLQEMFPGVPILGLSATPFRPSDKIRVNDVMVARNMGEEFFEGHYAVEMYYTEAWMSDEIDLNPPLYIAAAYIESRFTEIEKKLKNIKSGIQKRILSQEYRKMRRSVDKAYGVDRVLKKYLKPDGHYIFFCRNIEHVKKMKEKMRQWLKGNFKNYELYEISFKSEDPFQILQQFSERDGRLKIIFSVDIIGEGIHVECDGVILGRPTKSVNVEIQQIGRGSQVGAKGTSLVIDLVGNMTYMSNLKHAIDEVNNQMKNLLNNSTRTELPEFTIIDESISLIQLIETFEKKIEGVKSNVINDEKIELIVKAYLYKHAPITFCLNQLQTTEENFKLLVQSYREGTV